MTDGYGDLLTDPRAFFEREAEDPSALWPTLLVLVVGALSAATFWVNWQRVSEYTTEMAQQGNPEAAQGMASIMAAAGAVAVAFAFLGAFVAWLYYGAVIYGVSALVDGEGDFKTTFLFVGWGFVPKVFEVLLRLVGNWYLASAVALPDEATRAAMQAYQQQVATHPVSVLLSLVGIASLLWSAYIWYEGVQVSRRLDSTEALVAVGVPVGLVMLTRLWSLVQALV